MRVFRPALLLVLFGIGYLTLTVYRSGGGWTGNVLSYSIVLQYWTPMTVFLLVGMVATIPPGVMSQIESDPFTVVRPSTKRAIYDSLARFFALMLPVILVGIGGSLFLTSRIADVTNATFQEIRVADPLTVRLVWLVFFIGPFTGSAMLLALSEIAGTYFVSNTLRIVVVGAVAFLDAINRLKSPFLSLSGTTLGIIQSPCCGEPVQIQTVTNSYWIKGAYWGNYVYTEDSQALIGPISADIAPQLIIARLFLLCLAICLIIGLGLLRVRNLQTALNETSDVSES